MDNDRDYVVLPRTEAPYGESPIVWAYRVWRGEFRFLQDNAGDHRDDPPWLMIPWGVRFRFMYKWAGVRGPRLPDVDGGLGIRIAQLCGDAVSRALPPEVAFDEHPMWHRVAPFQSISRQIAAGWRPWWAV